MKKKDKKLIIICVILLLGILSAWIYGNYYRKTLKEEAYNDGIEQIDVNSIYLTDSGVKVSFSEVIIGTQQEVRKLIVSTQEAKVSAELSDALFKILGLDIGTKKQTVSYTGTGYFVVDLDNLTKDDIIVDSKNKIVTIKIGHPYLQAVEIDPNNVIIDEVQKGLLVWGDLKLTVNDYNEIEKKLLEKMQESLNTVDNAREADAVALRMVEEIFAPLIKAVDSRYSIEVRFR